MTTNFGKNGLWDYFTHTMVEMKPQSNIAWSCYAKLSALVSVLAVFAFSIGISMYVYLDAWAILYNAGVVVLVQGVLVPLFLLFLRREEGKTWMADEIGLEIIVPERNPFVVKWEEIREIFFKSYSVSIFHGEDNTEEIIYFMGGDVQDQFARLWHTYRADFPDRKYTAPEDNKGDS